MNASPPPHVCLSRLARLSTSNFLSHAAKAKVEGGGGEPRAVDSLLSNPARPRGGLSNTHLRLDAAAAATSPLLSPPNPHPPLLPFLPTPIPAQVLTQVRRRVFLLAQSPLCLLRQHRWAAYCTAPSTSPRPTLIRIDRRIKHLWACTRRAVPARSRN